MEAAAIMRFSAKIQGAKRERAEAEARAKAEAEIRESCRRRGRRHSPRQECGRKPMIFRGQRRRLPPKSESMQRSKDQRDRGRRLRQGPRQRLRSSKRRRR